MQNNNWSTIPCSEVRRLNIEPFLLLFNNISRCILVSLGGRCGHLTMFCPNKIQAEEIQVTSESYLFHFMFLLSLGWWGWGQHSRACLFKHRSPSSSSSIAWELVRNANSWSRPRPTESESLELTPSTWCFQKPSRWLWCMLTFENSCLWDCKSIHEDLVGW